MPPKVARTLKRTVRVLIVDDHPLLCEGLRACIESQPDLEVCGVADSVDRALEQVRGFGPDLLIVDMSLAKERRLAVSRPPSI